MKAANLNWIPTDVYGTIWRFVYFLDIKDEQNYSYIPLAEIKECRNGRWYWRFLVKKLDKHPARHTRGICYSRDEAIRLIKSYFK
ncbi:MAG TPA: hypothetical protein P5050_03525 [Bacteroidia bacterium]|nr:hypothetical protein [Bacteroidia bacterium]HRS58270.1 hypothetical protein [Bacteroidia bacterium]HRU67702.1 hypothetical protein [Bacteroidia bacterium]